MNIRDMKISRKLWISPGIFTIAIVLLGIVAIDGFSKMKTSSERLYLENSLKIEDSLTLFQKVSEIHSAAFRVLSWASNGIEEDLIVKNLQEISDDLAKLEKQFKAFHTKYAFDDAGKKELKLLGDMVAKYIEAARGGVEMLEIDTATAVIMMVGTNDVYVELDGVISKRIDAWKKIGQKEFSEFQRNG